MRAAARCDFEAKFTDSADPWSTFSGRDEACKRAAVLHALRPGRAGRVLELGAGAGANSVALAARALRLDATDGALASVRLIARALQDRPRARALRLRLPGRFPHAEYDTIVVAEVLYYLSPRAMTLVAREVRRQLRRGGRLVLAHHHIDFHDFAQPAAGLHGRFLRRAGGAWRAGARVRTSRWTVLACTRLA